MTGATASPGADPLGTIPLFSVNEPLTSPDPALIRDALSGLAAIKDLRRDLDQREHDLIATARKAGATWRQIAASLGSNDRQAAQQRHQALTRALAREPDPSQTRTRRRDQRKYR
jgi:hypothetical protein